MKYSIIEKNINESAGFQTLTGRSKKSSCIFGVADSIKPFFLHCLNQNLSIPIIFICKNNKDAKTYYDKDYVKNACWFPPKDMEFQHFEAKSREEENFRVNTLKKLVDKNVEVVYTSLDALLQKLSPSRLFSENILDIKKGEIYDIDVLYKKCISLGYMNESLVEGEGSIAKRGSIMDIYVPSEYAYRIDFFGDEIDSIKTFDPLTQRTVGEEIQKITVSCATEFVFDQSVLDAAIDKLEPEISNSGDSDLEYEFELLKQGKSFDGIDKYLFAFYKGSTIFDYAQNCLIVFDGYEFAKQEAEVFIQEVTQDFEQYENLKKAIHGQIHNLFSVDYIVQCCEQIGCHEFAMIKPSDMFKRAQQLDFGFKSPNAYRGNFEQLSLDVNTRIQNAHRVHLYTGDEKNERIIHRFFENHGVATDKINIHPYPLGEGVEFSDQKCLVLGEKDIFGFSKQVEKTAKNENLLDFITDLVIGDIVVHELHGRGRYLGLKTMDVQGKRRDYIHLEYKGGDKLYIPTEQIDRVQKYVGGQTLTLSKLGGKEWDQTKKRVSKSVKELAFDLVSIYSERTLNKGFEFSVDSDWQEDFEAYFPYSETEGQLQCAAEIKADMQSKKVMDRLLLGDVGFGKTEVAMRACFKAVYDQKQVAVLAPTTLLARQHYENFIVRFKNFPVKTGQLSRFVTQANKKKVLQALEQGNLDIVVGTHALLSDKVIFKDLGLLVVDEEQRFGVGHKEKIKNLKKNVDVLTLSATPIPRTLEMSLVGIRDMSILKTPPTQRKRIKTYVVEYSKSILQRAISREIERNGQTYVVCKRIKDIDFILNQIRQSVPTARVTYVHGQLAEREIEVKMDDYYAGKYDVLVSTTIIESGIDIPNSNTLIVYEAQKYGLSQLYQIKGRIGRSDKKAVCYLTYLKGAYLSLDARKRLDAIKENTDFGAGFKIAMKDLEIRGAGNLLGSEQSGHMDKIGYDMYCKLMKKAVKQAKGEVVNEPVECSVELAMDAYIPPHYIDDESIKIEAYKMISSVKNTKHANEILKELSDRFGSPPLSVKNLITVSLVKRFCEICGFASITRLGDGFKLKYSHEARVDFEKLMTILNEYQRTVKLNPTQPPTLIFNPKKSMIKELFTFLNRISRCTIG